VAGARLGSGAALSKTIGLKRIGILGGSFNPAHGGHRRVTLAVIKQLNLDEVWWLVSPGNPLKPKAGMAPLAKRFASAQKQARRAPIKVSAVERELHTRYTIDTLRKLLRRYPKQRFVWLMGADNLAQFGQWKNWRDIARLLPIAVIARPGYERVAFASPAMVWLRRFRRASYNPRAEWSAPALIYYRFNPDPRSASAIRRADPHWASNYPAARLRDGVTRNIIPASRA
jgi:nicotinate-nucleotide adenylyltransferase